MIKKTIAIIGLGYVGLPLAIEFGKQYKTIGFDVNQTRIDELETGVDNTLEVSSEQFKESLYLSYTADIEEIAIADIYIVTVPTPIDQYKKPDLSPLRNASKALAGVISKNNIVIYESTVYPGATEEVCIPIIEDISGLIFNQDFFAGYSPERINPGDKTHRVTDIKKVTSGSTPEIAAEIDQLYQSIITAGTYQASSIKVAEAAKVIENTQRDINIALINELSLIFKRLHIDTEEVLLAAGSKWNFLPFRPGLVGGHCIGVDPYYLTQKAIEVGYNPEIILAGRRLNDSMGKYIANEVTNLMTKKRIHIVDSHILIMGLSFKENCPDLRNSRVIDIINELQDFNCHIHVYDPWADKKEAEKEYKVSPIEYPQNNFYDAIVLAVAHQEFKTLGIEKIKSFGKTNSIIFDVKYLFTANDVDARL